MIPFRCPLWSTERKFWSSVNGDSATLVLQLSAHNTNQAIRINKDLNDLNMTRKW